MEKCYFIISVFGFTVFLFSPFSVVSLTFPSPLFHFEESENF